MNANIALLISFVFLLSSCDEYNDSVSIEGDHESTSLFESCPSLVDTTSDKYHQLNTTSQGVKWWILSRQHAPCEGERGIFLFNESTTKLEVKIDIPNELLSPHGLEYKDGFLWLAGFSDSQKAYQIDPNNGEIVRVWNQVSGEGIAVSGDSIFVANNGYIDLLSRSGESLINTFQLNTSTVQDITVKGDDIYYVVNGELDPILKLNMKTEKIDTIVLTGITALYTLACKDDDFFAIEENTIVKIDSSTGDISIVGVPQINGWLTSIRPY